MQNFFNNLVFASIVKYADDFKKYYKKEVIEVQHKVVIFGKSNYTAKIDVTQHEK